MFRLRFRSPLFAMLLLGVSGSLMAWHAYAFQDASAPLDADLDETFLIPYSTTGAPANVLLKCETTPWLDVLRNYCNSAGCRLNVSQLPNGTFTHEDGRKYTAREALDVINGELIEQNFLAVRHDEFLVGVNLRLPFPPELALTVPVRELKHCGRNEFLQVTFPISARKLASLANTNQTFVGDYKRFSTPTLEKRMESVLPLSPYGRVVSAKDNGFVTIMDFGLRMPGIRNALADMAKPNSDVKSISSEASENWAQASTANATKAYLNAQRRAELAALDYRKLIVDGTAQDETVRQLREIVKAAVTDAFDERQRLQEDEVENFARRLEALRRSLRDREAVRDRIIGRRVEELLSNEDLTWPADPVDASVQRVRDRIEADKRLETQKDRRLPKPFQRIAMEPGPFAANFEIADVAYFEARQFKTPGPIPRVVAEEVIAWTLSASRDLSAEELQRFFDCKGLSEDNLKKVFESDLQADLMFRLSFFKTDGDREITADAREQGYPFQPYWNRQALSKGEQIRIWVPLGKEGAAGLINTQATKARFLFPNLAEIPERNGDESDDE